MAWVIAGLGNPGEEYTRTRHNTGRMALEFFAHTHGFSEWKADKKNKATVSKGAINKTLVALVAPDTFMNKSGSAVVKYVKTPKSAERLVVVYDDLDLALGTIKLSYDRGSGGHKGLESIMRALKTKKFARVRIGVSRATASGKIKKPSGEKDVLDFILGKFSFDEMDELKKVFKRVSEAINTIVLEGPTAAMNRFN
jgi:PTH1 family peptidyl-tRNA hydrolase